MPTRKLAIPDEVYEQLQKFLPEAVRTREYLQGCVDCGLSLEKELEECKEQIAVAEKIKETFFPGRP